MKSTEGASMQDQLVIMPATGANIKKARDRPRLRFWAAPRRQKIETLDGELLWFREGNVGLIAQLQPSRPQQSLTMAMTGSATTISCVGDMSPT
jgi:hypothetical protein